MGNICCRHQVCADVEVIEYRKKDREDREDTEGLIKINLDFMERLHDPNDITESEL